MNIPLSEKLRPTSFDDVAGQKHLLDKNSWFLQSIASKKPLSFLLFGPPGCGKTTLARIYAKSFPYKFVALSGVSSGIKEIKKLIEQSLASPLFSLPLILFIDEIHRFNKAQQDVLLPFIEDGTVIFIGATTENPSFSINNALLSRLRVIPLHALSPEALNKIIDRYINSSNAICLTNEVKEYLISISSGDGRHLLNMLENLAPLSDKKLDLEMLYTFLQRKPALYDKDQDGHYQLISALHKSIRGSDPDAAIYWATRMLDGGEDPLFVARRLIRTAIEDIGLADPNATQIALNAMQVCERLGSPEGQIALIQTTIYLALAPKSNAVYSAYQKAQEVAGKTSHLSPPKSIINAPTKLMKEMGYGKGYIYDHDLESGVSKQNYFPAGLNPESFYHPKNRGFEREMIKRALYYKKMREED